MSPGYDPILPPGPDAVAIFDPAVFHAALGEDTEGGDEYLGPEDERPAPQRTTEEAIRATIMNRILADPRGPLRPVLRGDLAMADQLLFATATMPHFSAVTGVLHRAVVQSALTGRPLRAPPLLLLSPPGVGKTYYCRTIASVLATTCVAISINTTSDRGQLGGLSPLWRGAKMGKIAKGLLIDSVTNAPLYLLDEVDKPPVIGADENVLDVLLSTLEPENARSFVDAYLDAPIDLTGALWIASANDIAAMPAPLLDRMLVVDVPRPTREQARVIAATIAQVALTEAMLIGVQPDALDPVLDLSPRRMRRALEMACGFAVYARRGDVRVENVRQALLLTERALQRAPIGFLPPRRKTAG